MKKILKNYKSTLILLLAIIIGAIVGIIFTGLRVPIAMLLFRPEILGINGVWWSISLSSVVKGILLVISFYFMVLKPFKKLNSAYRSTNALN